MKHSRHAYCIIAHDKPHQLARLVEMIDDPRNDIFILIDGKTDSGPFERQTKTQYSGVRFLEYRPKIYWGTFSMIDAILRLLDVALEEQNPARIHLLSGADMPLMSQDEIHRICDDLYPDNEFIEVSTDPEDMRQADERTAHSYPFLRYARPNLSIGHLAFGLSRRLMRLLPKRRIPATIYKGEVWFSLTNAAAAHIVSRQDEIRKLFRHAFNSDELYAQTILMNSKFADSIHPQGNLRAIDWNRGRPYVWTEKDLDELINSGAMFGRKFDMDQHPILIDRLSRKCINEQSRQN